MSQTVMLYHPKPEDKAAEDTTALVQRTETTPPSEVPNTYWVRQKKLARLWIQFACWEAEEPDPIPTQTDV